MSYVVQPMSYILMVMGLLILGLVLFLLLVVLHEFGHFIAARRGGVEVEEFGIGFPPMLFSKHFKNHKTKYTINLLPLGGFVRLKGEHDSDRTAGSYGAARMKTKIKIMLAGVGMNFAIAWFMLLILCIIGIPQLPLPGGEQQFKIASDSHETSNSLFVSYVEPGSPADDAGIKVRDKIVKAGPTSCSSNELCGVRVLSYTTFDDEKSLSDFTKENAGKEIELEVITSDGRVTHPDTVLRSDEEVSASKNTSTPKGFLGVVPYEYVIARSTWSAPIVAAGLTYQFTKVTLQGLGSAIKSLVIGNTSEATQNVSGPVGIFFVLKDGSSLGFRYVLLIVALLSLTLAIMNVLPIPALDGGRLFVTLLFLKLKKPLTSKIEERIHGTGFAALMILFVLITVVDVRRFF